MIDFRYHVVSLLAVFLALAVGIVLGAGPLQQGLGTQLTNQVSQLRTEKAELNGQLTQATKARSHSDELAKVIGPATTAGRLTEATVAIVVLPSADDQLVSDTRASIEAAGGTVTSVAQVQEAWFDKGSAAKRESAAGTLASALGLPAPGASADAVSDSLGRALAYAVGEPSQGATNAADAGAVRETLATNGLATVTPDQPQRARYVVVVGGVYGGDKAVVDARSNAIRRLITGMTGRTDGVLVVEGDPTPPAGQPATSDIITAVRADSVVARTVSSLDNAQHSAGQVELVLALVALTQDVRGHYGPVAGNVPPAPKATAGGGSSPQNAPTPSPTR